MEGVLFCHGLKLHYLFGPGANYDYYSVTAFCPVINLLFDIIINSLVFIWLGRSPSGAGSS